MDADRFDSWTRRLSSRRTALTTLAGSGLAALGAWLDAGGAEASGRDELRATATRCRRGRKKCRGKCIPKRQCCTNANCGAGRVCQRGSCVCDAKGGFEACGRKCIPQSGCCTTGDCDPGDICAEHQCVTGQGTCPTGEDICTDFLPPFNCGNGETPRCACVQTMAGETRCGGSVQGATCGECTSDEECAGRGPGAFCGKTTSNSFVCTCNTGQGFCVIPCAV